MKMDIFTLAKCFRIPIASVHVLMITQDIKLDNVLVNYRDGDVRFSDVQIGDLGGSYPEDSKWARGGTPIGAPMWTSPEVIMETPWNTATDIWSFGSLVC